MNPRNGSFQCSLALKSVMNCEIPLISWIFELFRIIFSDHIKLKNTRSFYTTFRILSHHHFQNLRITLESRFQTQYNTINIFKNAKVNK